MWLRTLLVIAALIFESRPAIPFANTNVAALAPISQRGVLSTGPASNRPSVILAAYGSIGPSFDCSSATGPLALLICSNPRLSYIDLTFVQAYQALRAQSTDEGKAEVRSEAIEFQQSVLSECGIPPTGPLTPAVQQSTECVAQHYTARRDLWMARLNQNSKEEATRLLQRHIALQKTLQDLGFISSFSKIEGVYGPETRGAISSWQRSVGLSDTGILGDRDAGVLEEGIRRKAADRDAEAARTEQQRIEQERRDREQADAQRRENDTWQAQLEACKAYQVSACDAALQSPNLGSWLRTQLIGWRSVGQQFAADQQACRNGTIAACDIAIRSPAASARDQVYLAQWADAASPWTRGKKYIGDTSASVMSVITEAPLSTLIASGIAVLLAAALVVLLIIMRRQSVQPDTAQPQPEAQPEAQPEPQPEPTPEPPQSAPHDYSATPRGYTKRQEKPSRPAASSSSGGSAEGLRPPHEAQIRASRQPKFIGGGTKAVGVAINVFFPGIGSFIVGKPIAGVCQIGLNICAVGMAATMVLAPVAVLVGLGSWIWAIAGAASAPTRPMQVIIQNGPVPGQL